MIIAVPIDQHRVVQCGGARWTAKRPQAAFDSGPDAAWGGLRAGNAVRRQLEALGGAHVGYGSLGVPGGSVAVVGGRPFSNGGAGWNANAALAARVAGLGGGEAASAGAIRDAILRQPPGAAVVVLSHNGPAGLGSTPPDPCGVDWRGGPARPRYAPQGDHGDTDLAAALDAATAAGRPPALVVFGHMHSDLRMGGQRRMLALAPAPAAPHTLLLNAAVVPRVRGLPGGGVGSHFAVVSLRGGRVVRVRECWVEVGAGGSCRLAEHRDLFYLAPGEDGREVAHLYNAFTEQYETAEPPRAPPVPAI